ncbi:MAG: hypothetical protein O0X93_01565 [Methanocorpusculum sp.]|nr:hypothetical protein [Methanocorpusculum sp.]MDE2521833.1 hypothetical protein [Methanocorpusculum sp.]MDE2524826.1 hypothetical protein [Methanocorpusculum sp.]
MRNLAALRARLDIITARHAAGVNVLQEIREMIDAAILTNGNEFREDLVRFLETVDEDTDLPELSQTVREFVDGWKPGPRAGNPPGEP